MKFGRCKCSYLASWQAIWYCIWNFWKGWIKIQKKTTHMWRRWGTPQNFLLAFTDEVWKTQQFRILKKWKNLLEISSFYTCVPKTTIIWGTVPEIQSETNFFCHFGPFFALYLPLHPNNPENQNFEKIRKASGDVIILNWCNKKHDRMMYAYTDMKCNRQFFVILGHFLLFYLTIDTKN